MRSFDHIVNVGNPKPVDHGRDLRQGRRAGAFFIQARARWNHAERQGKMPPADSPVTTKRLTSKLYIRACEATHFNAQKQSSTAAGARATRPSLYSTFTTFQPISNHGISDISAPSLFPATQKPPCM